MLTVRLHGHLSAQFGLAGGAAATARLLEAVGCRVVANDLRLTSHPSLQPLPEATAAPGPVHLDLVHTNPNLLAANPELLRPSQLPAPLRIGYWAWELEAFPEGWEQHFADYDEIWCPSSFAAQSLAQRSPIPVIAVPHLPDWPRLDALQRARATHRSQPAAARPFRILSLFDFWSTPERKNPAGAIAAFQRAFPLQQQHSPPVELLIKTSSADQFPEARAALEAATRTDPRIHWRHGLLSAAAMDQLLLEADALLSLHRSEGFGLVLADAMAIGLPVLATGYSGNLEFMPPDTAALLPWQLQTIERTSGDYRRGWAWAEPDPQAAADALRRVVRDPAGTTAMAARAASAIRERLSPERLGAIVRQRLGTLLLKPSRRQLLASAPATLSPLG